MNTNWTILLMLLAAVAIVFMVRKSGRISASQAVEQLKQGALVIDVRTPGEFNAGHLPRAINIPLDEIETVLPARVKDKNQVLLLHCASGMRSGVARSQLKRLGYANAFNLGSYSRAESLLRRAN